MLITAKLLLIGRTQVGKEAGLGDLFLGDMEGLPRAGGCGVMGCFERFLRMEGFRRYNRFADIRRGKAVKGFEF
jgi:hypothetical protein